MNVLNGLALGLWILCEVYIWYDTATVEAFIFYSVFANIFGALMGIPGGLFVGRTILKSRKKKDGP